MKRAFGTASLVVAALAATASVGLLAEENFPVEDAAIPIFLAALFAFTGFSLLRDVERPIFGDGPAPVVASTLCLALAAIMATIFVGIVFAGDGAHPNDGAIPLFLSLLFGGTGLALRGNRTSGSFAGRLTLFGVAAVAVPLLLLLFVFASTSEDSDITVDDGPFVVGVDEGEGEVPSEVAVATVLLMVCSAGAVWFWSRRAVAPMAEITQVANEIQAGSLDRRIGLRCGGREVQQLADSFDSMLDRLAQASATQQRMIEDTSHELRTPIAALAVNNEVALSVTDPKITDYRATIQRNQALVQRLQTTVDELLAQGRAANQRLQQVDNDLMSIVERVSNQHRILNPNVPIAIRGPQELRLGIDGPSVQRALENLVDNAARYSPPGVPVEIDVTPGETEAHLSVTDHGPGIASEDLDTVFERYYQADPTDGGTAGIGLALVKQVAEAHGRIDVASPISEGRGTRFTLSLRFGSDGESRQTEDPLGVS